MHDISLVVFFLGGLAGIVNLTIAIVYKDYLDKNKEGRNLFQLGKLFAKEFSVIGNIYLYSLYILIVLIVIEFFVYALPVKLAI